jgi:ssDNA-binding Zn-finger/Zn-ribbon topoisomerase 1
MIYTCGSCRFTFSRVSQVESCPDCGKPHVREATDKEKDDYNKFRDEEKKNQKRTKE